MQRGTELEPLARNFYELMTDNEVTEVGFCMHDQAQCGISPDGLIGDEGGLEIKCPAPQTHVKYLRDNKLPTQYKQQVQGCLWITGREWWDFVSFHESMPVMTVRVQRDDDYIQLLEAEVLKAVETIETEVNRLKEM
jgi:dihydrofolate reductase